MHIETLVRMANDIGAFFASEPDKDEAAREVLGHIKRYWDPRMRLQIAEYYDTGALGLSGPVREAIRMLAAERTTAGKSPAT